jgi:polyisoprenoid-binding protein YceI
MAQAAQEITTTGLPPAGTYELDVTHTTVEFVARHMLSKTRGRFTDFTGAIVVGDSPETSSVNVEIEAASIQTNMDKRDEHLKSGDFLELETYPTLSFKSTAVRATGGDRFELDGELTIKGATKSVTLTGEFLGFGNGMQGNVMFGASARTTINREDFGMTWNVAVEAGGVLVGKKVDIEIEVEAHKVS